VIDGMSFEEEEERNESDPRLSFIFLPSFDSFTCLP